MQECFNSPYGTGFFSTYAERIPGESTQLLSEAAKENKVYLVGGKRTNYIASACQCHLHRGTKKMNHINVNNELNKVIS